MKMLCPVYGNICMAQIEESCGKQGQDSTSPSERTRRIVESEVGPNICLSSNEKVFVDMILCSNNFNILTFLDTYLL